MAVWTLLYGGVEKSFADWGLRGLTRRQSSQSQYEVTFSGLRQAFDAAPLFAYGQTVVIKRNGVRWWSGPVISTPTFGSAQTERIDYVIASPWWYLENITFQQAWAYFTGTSYAKRYSSHVFLGQGIKWLQDDGVTPMVLPEQIRYKTHTVIREIIEFANSTPSGQMIAVNSGDLPASLSATDPMCVYIPADEAREINCAEAIRRVAKWLRDLVVWWDFTTTIPTLRFQRRQQLSTAALTIGKKPLAEISLTPRYDLQVSAVVLKYEQTDEVDGNVDLITTAKYAPASIPDDAEHAAAYAAAAEAASKQVGAMVCTIDLQGRQATNVYATLKSEAIVASNASQASFKAWWAKRYPWLLDPNIGTGAEDLVFSEFSRASSLPNELVEGAWAPWISGVTAESDTIEGSVRIKYYKTVDGVTTLDKVDVKRLSAKVVVTNSPAGTRNYSTTESYAAGDAIPEGLHTDIYNALAVLQYSGRITLREEECGDWLLAQSIAPQAGLGLRINVLGGTGVFASIGSVVQQCDEDIDSGTTGLTIGPPEQLSPQDLVSLLEVTRTRLVWTNPAARAQGMTGGGSAVNYPRETARESANSHTTGYEKLTVSTPATTGQATPIIVLSQGSHTCTLDLADAVMTLPGGSVKIPLKIRKLKYCKGNVQKNIWVLCSGLYNDDGSSAGEP